MSDAEDVFPALADRHPSLCSLEELEEKYWDEVAPDMVAAGMNPDEERPSYRWLSSNGHRDLIYALKEYHGLTFGDFWTETLGLEAEDPGYDWPISDPDTIDAVETFLDRRSGTKWGESTVDSHRTRLSRYLDAYAGVNSSDDLMTPIAPGSDVPEHEAKDACWRAFERLDAEYQRSTVEKTYRSVHQWYQHLSDRGLATTDPSTVVDSNFDWGQDDSQNQSIRLTSDQIGRLYETAKDNRERAVIIALCAWGLRTNEVAALHEDQLQLDSDTPYIQFDERKNGPSTVNVAYGVHDAQVRVARLRTGDDWDGYLFPSTRSTTGHVTRGTILRWFQDIAERAGIDDADGEKPVPKMARKFWYDAYSSIFTDVLEHVQGIAEEQGSKSAEVVWKNYLTEERRRELRRELMREKLAAAFEDVEA
jgi:site-specific recombinase XerD